MNTQYHGNDHVLITRGYDSMPYITSTVENSGQLRYNSVIKNLEVYDGVVWRELRNPDVNITLSHRTEYVLEWAEKKMQSEKDLIKLAEKYPALKDAKEKLDIIMALINDEQK